MTQYDTLIVGAGHAGSQLAIALRQGGYEGRIAMIGLEPDPPYERPPLSKDFLVGDKSFERILIRPEGFWADKGIDWMGGRAVISVDPVARSVYTQDGEVIGYGQLVWAAGGAARRLTMAGGDAHNVHVVRTRADAEGIMAGLPDATHVTIIGGGYVGLETAAVMRKRGKSVTLVEAGPRVLGRVAGAALSAFYEAEHRRQGVDLRLDARLAALEQRDGLVHVVRLADGSSFATDMLIVGIGIDPLVGPLAAAGADMAGGVRVDAYCRASLAHVYAIGDCAVQRCRFADGAEIRLESVQNASDQARTVAAHILGREAPHDALPWFWSNQYDLKLQTAGLATGHDEAVVRGDPEARSFSVLYLRERRLIAVDAVNRVKDYVQARALIEQGMMLDPAILADASITLKDAAALAVAERASGEV